MTFLLWLWVIGLSVLLFKMHKKVQFLEKSIKVRPDQVQAQKVEPKVVDPKETTVHLQPMTIEQPQVEGKLPLPKEPVPKEPLPNKMKKSGHLAWSKKLFSVESIITKLGIVLLLIGVGFIFKLAYDSGFITRELIIGFGFLFGIGLIIMSERVTKHKRLVLGQVLAGGGIATLYITTYAAYQGYNLIPGFLAFIFMCVVTFVAFFISVTKNALTISVIGLIGGLLTPFLLQLEQLGIEGTGLYVVVLAIGAMVIYAIKGWRTLQLCSVVGTYIITTYFITYPDMSGAMSFKLAGLFISTLLVFSITEYGLMTRKIIRSKWPIISYLLTGILPLITLLQAVVVLELKDNIWGLALGVVALVYMVVTAFLYRKLGDTYLSSITLSLIAVFAFLSVLMFFGADIEAIGVLLIGVVYLVMHKRWSNFYVGLIGRIIVGIGYLMALSTLIEGIIDHSPDLKDWLVRLSIILILILVTLLVQTKDKMVVMSLNVFGYSFVAVLSQIYWWADNNEVVAMMVIGIILYMWFMWALYHFTKLLPRLGLVILSALPMMVKVLLLLIAFFEERSLFENLVLVAYVVSLYGLITVLYRDHKSPWKSAIKMMVYSLTSLIIYIDLSLGLDLFGPSMLLVGVGYLLYVNFEPDRGVKSMDFYGKILGWSWVVVTLSYPVVVMGRSFIWVGLGADALIILLLWVVLIQLQLKPVIVKVVLHTLAFGLVVFMNFSNLAFGNGIITLLLAAYSIGVLSISVVKVQRQLVTYGLVLIILVALKFVIIDLATVKMLWKIIISMGFGSALLVLSYFLQPILNQSNS